MSLHDIWLGDVMPMSGVAVAIGRNSYDPPAPVVPVYDIHARELDLHDSGGKGDGGSGIVTYNAQTTTEGGRLELIPSMSGTQSVMTAVYIDVYDTTGGNTITNSQTVVGFDTTRENSHPDIFVFSNANDTIQINQTGKYLVEYRVTYVASANTRSSSRTYLERQAAGGAFSEVAGTRTLSYHRDTLNLGGTATAKLILDVTAGDTLRLSAIRLTGVDLTQFADGTSLTIQKLE